MVNKVIITPTEVRGQGNIISPYHGINAYIRYLSSLSETDGLFTLEYEPYSMNLTVSEDEINYGESIILSCSVSGAGVSVEGETVTFYSGSTSLGTDTITEGVATLTVSNLAGGVHELKAVYDNTDSNIVSVTVYKLPSTISLSVDETLVDSGDSVTLTGTLSAGSGASVKIMNNGVLVDTVTTSTGGAFTKTVTMSSYGVFRAVFEGNDAYNEISSSTMQVYVMGDDYIELTFTGSQLSQYAPNLTPLGGEGIVIDYGDGTIVKVTDGKYGHTYSSSGDYTIKMYNVTGIGNYGFSGCTGITEVDIPNTVTNYGTDCFNGCTGLTSVSLPNNLTALPSLCFYNCTGLTSISLPDTLTSIGDYCFYKCNGLSSVTIPNSVTSMGNYCFDRTDIPNAYLEWSTSGTILTYNLYWFYYGNNLVKFHIPSGTTSLYTAKGYPSDKLVEESPAPSVDSLTLVKSAGKQVLSYADKTSGSGNTEFCTLTATALDSNSQGVSGQSVVFKNGDTTLDTVTTDSNGEASYTYVSQGVGDVTITAECRLLIQTYVITDALLYRSGALSISNLSITLPTHFEATVKIKRNTSSNVGTLNLWRDNTHAIGVGLFNASTGQHGLGHYTGSWSVQSFGAMATGVTKEFKYTYDNGDNTLELDGATKTLSQTNNVVKIDCNSSGAGVTISDLLIKPL